MHFEVQTLGKNYRTYDTRKQPKEAHHESFKIYPWAKMRLLEPFQNPLPLP